MKNLLLSLSCVLAIAGELFFLLGGEFPSKHALPFAGGMCIAAAIIAAYKAGRNA